MFRELKRGPPVANRKVRRAIDVFSPHAAFEATLEATLFHVVDEIEGARAELSALLGFVAAGRRRRGRRRADEQR